MEANYLTPSFCFLVDPLPNYSGGGVSKGCVGSHGRGEEHGDGGGGRRCGARREGPEEGEEAGGGREPDKEEKKEEEDKQEESKPLPACCSTCNSVVVWYDEPNVCRIL